MTRLRSSGTSGGVLSCRRMVPGARGRRSLLKSVVPQTPRVPRRYRSVSKNSDEFAHEAGGSVSHTTLECAPGCCDLLLLGEGSGFVELVVGDDAVSVRVCGAEARVPVSIDRELPSMGCRAA